jgi:4a-hydroxytetrahydrobiopterin dehydratase
MADVLNPDALHTALNQLEGWDGTVQAGITKTYQHNDFAEAMAFVNRVADLAERMNHHPDIQISWATVSLRILSHAKGGVTEDCVELARAIDLERHDEGARAASAP